LGPLARALRENYPHLVTDFYRFDGITVVVSNGDKHFRDGLQVGDSTLLTMYGFEMLRGDARSALNNPFTVVITDDKAMKYFGRTDVVGSNLTIDNFSGGRQDFRITGVIKRPSRNTINRLTPGYGNGIFVPTSNLAYFGRNMDWPNGSIASFVELQKGVTPEDLKEPIHHLLRLNTTPNVVTNLYVKAVPLTRWYLETNNGAVEKMLYTLAFIALFILGMAVINFINLSVSRSSTRMKEIGIRKVLGGLRRQLRMQFLTESIVLAVASTALALVLYQLLLPLATEMLGEDIPSLSAMPVTTWGLILLFAIFTGWLAGLYPAMLLSSLSSVDALKAKGSSVKENVLLRKGLVGVQFGTATLVFIGAIIVSQQIDLFFSDSLGYNKDFIVSAQLPRDWSAKGVDRMETIRDVFSRLLGVKAVTLSYEIPNGNNSGSFQIYREGEDSTQAILAQSLTTDGYYASTYQIPLAAGVFFHPAGGSASQDSTYVVLNETTARALGWASANEAVGQRVRLVGFNNKIFTVSGVARDFHFDAMGAAIQPQVFGPVSLIPLYRYFSFKLAPGHINESLDRLQQRWAKLMPGAPFEYKFMDETLQMLYESELRLRRAAQTATALTFVIVLLGVVGLVSNSVRRRTKEIAIRKVIGADVSGIIRLFIREYLPVLLVAGAVASPLAYWLMERWLNNYMTKITITLWPFAMAIGCLALVMVTLIVVQTFSAATRNPVESLKVD
jgi:putative ABC transport system permease protein